MDTDIHGYIDYIIELLHLALIGFFIYVPLFSCDRILLKLVIIVIIMILLSWNIYGECPVFKMFKNMPKLHQEMHKISQSDNSKYLSYAVMLTLCTIALLKL